MRQRSSRSAGTSWQRLAPKLSSSTAGLVVGDFSGDGRDDIAQKSGDGWRYWRNGTTVWNSLRGAGGQTQYADPTSSLIGHFNHDGREDAIRYELLPSVAYSGSSVYLTYVTGTRFVGWDGNGDSFRAWMGDYVR